MNDEKKLEKDKGKRDATETWRATDSTFKEWTIKINLITPCNKT